LSTSSRGTTNQSGSAPLPRRLDAGGSREPWQLCTVCRRGAPGSRRSACRGTSPAGTSSERGKSLVARPGVLTPLTLRRGPAFDRRLIETFSASVGRARRRETHPARAGPTGPLVRRAHEERLESRKSQQPDRMPISFRNRVGEKILLIGGIRATSAQVSKTGDSRFESWVPRSVRRTERAETPCTERSSADR